VESIHQGVSQKFGEKIFEDSTGRTSAAWGGEPPRPSGQLELGEVPGPGVNAALAMVAIGMSW